MERYNVFTRTWWRREAGKLVPHAGRKTYLETRVTLDEARRICREWNAENKPGPLSRKAEFTAC